ncbi:E3 ubiquitin-protein ligase Os06g0535400-like [Panicum virgatum]|uniref:E3 ubiquitin-protein ligase Os06g0535400-like n=1 Tax=Panicum virgatum TaxID=38727 RepID=UPI0019D577DD|nr:E3 ubiquitin-protein ligase Os06g0535400-like [Panicum virgatum]
MEGGGQFLDQQPDQDDIDRELVMFAVRSFAHGGFHSPAAAAAPAAMSTEYYYALGLAGGQASSVRAADHRPFPVQDGAAPAAWSRVAPCGHRFHAACVEKWLRVKPSCPVCRRPAAPSPPAAVPGAMN